MISYQHSDYLFELPAESIAQAPASSRDHSRLLKADAKGAPNHAYFHDLAEFLKAGDLLVLNQTKVMNARCFAFKPNGTRVEVFFLDIQNPPEAIPVMVKPAKRVRRETVLQFPNAGVTAVVSLEPERGKAMLSFSRDADVHAVIHADGNLPLPPYIKRPAGPVAEDETRYQTVYARDLGAVAAPTAGLHFTRPLLRELDNKGIESCFITHHVGVGTFKPLIAKDIREHVMEPETYTIDETAAARLNAARDEKRRIIAVGTTSTRCLESNQNSGFHARTTSTDLYIYPGYRFKAIQGMITNFHLPGSSLILLVSALMGRERILALYREAIQRNYRFYSYGDAMLLLP